MAEACRLQRSSRRNGFADIQSNRCEIPAGGRSGANWIRLYGDSAGTSDVGALYEISRRMMNWIRRQILALLLAAVFVGPVSAGDQFDWIPQPLERDRERSDVDLEERPKCYPTRVVGIAETAEDYYASCQSEPVGEGLRKGLKKNENP